MAAVSRRRRDFALWAQLRAEAGEWALNSAAVMGTLIGNEIKTSEVSHD